MSDNNICIYALIDPRTDEIRYVGLTKDPHRRWSEHTGGSGENKTKNRWLSGLYKSRNLPKMLILDWVPEDDAHEYEAMWIRTLLEDGGSLTNIVGNPSQIKTRNRKWKRPATFNRPAIQTPRVYGYMDKVLSEVGRIASYSEVQQVLGLASSTASTLRKQWLAERGISETTGDNGNGEAE